MAGPRVLVDLERRKKVGEIIQATLIKHGVILRDFHNKIHVSDEIIVEHTSKKAGLSQAIFDHMFPKEPSPSTLYHYTDLDGLAGIASSAELRLYPIRKRIDEGGELSAFAKAHDLTGYLSDNSGEEPYKKMSDDLFYVSLTRVPPKNPSLMWGVFAAGTGVRLELEVEPKWSELRPVYYEQKGTVTLLADINANLTLRGHPPLTPWGISRAGAFHLLSNVSSEDEVRLLVKRFEGGTDLTQNDGKYDFWPISIGTPNDYCSIKLTGIHAAPNGDINKIRSKIACTAFEAISLTGP